MGGNPALLFAGLRIVAAAAAQNFCAATTVFPLNFENLLHDSAATAAKVLQLLQKCCNCCKSAATAAKVLQLLQLRDNRAAFNAAPYTATLEI